ncbi:alpha-2-macroglobulin isoform X2 [Megalops cyprinoides]|uniref:alpha-2-macroglobulin isoform X2 n=1 Tax=Megalops cyprinoides TaxID=118141 RepID=UPI001863C4E1|nr:alpha-2-macroglobulin isoform X2 [Megalops cyprinoides]
MIALLFCTSVLLPTAFAGSANESIYMVTVTSQTVGGSTETICAQIHQPKGPVSFTITLEMEGIDNMTLLEESVKEDFYRCLPFQVPSVRSDTVATVHAAVHGATEDLNKKSKILIKPRSFLTIVQTDKPVYKPGQIVQFRIVSMDDSFLPYNQVYDTVELQDPNMNRIAQWLNRSTTSGILDLSHRMTPEAAQGTYVITAMSDSSGSTSHTFDIKEYVLPKYEVKVHLPNVITILDTRATLQVCGKYTYGKPVLGSVKAVVCRKSYRHYWYSETRATTDICKEYSMTTDKSGCATETIDVRAYALNETQYEDSLEVDSEMEEYGTGVLLKGSGSARLSSDIVTVTFEESPQAFKPGIPYEGKVKVVGADSSPVRNETVLLMARYKGQLENRTLVTDSRGMADFSLDTTPWELNTVNLQAHYRQVEEDFAYVRGLRRPNYRYAQQWVKPFHSKSNSFLKIKQVKGKLPCDTDVPIMAQYIIQGEELEKEQESLDIFYLVLSRGSIKQHGRLQVPVTAGQVHRGEVSVSLQRLTDLAPYAQVVVYTVLPDGEAVADSADFPIQLCLKNKVSLKFSSLQELPGEKTSLSLKAQPGSLCSVRAIDQSVLLLQPEQEISVDSVYNQLPVQRLSGYPYNVEDLDPYPCIGRPFVEEVPVDEPEEVPAVEATPAAELEVVELDAVEVETQPASKRKRSIYFGPSPEKHDVYNIFKDVGIKIITNSDVKKPIDCYNHIFAYRSYSYDSPVPMAFNMERTAVERLGATPSAADEPQETVRTYFPETWIWDLVPVGDSGSVKVEHTVPDTITKWAADALCTSSVGVGLSPSVGFTAFQPFFISLTLPYSVVRGEVFTIKATVFNYLSKCIMVQVSLAETEQYTARPCVGCEYTHCLCGEESRTFSWILTPTTLGEVSVKVSAVALKTEDLCGNEVATVPERGRVDTVVRTLIVEAEGTKETISHNALLCPAEGAVQEKVSLKLPEVYVEGSAKAFLSVLGDLMGRAMRNLDSLLAMPYGCGEQNMVLFAPNIYILKYLESTSQLTQEVKDKATRFLESGYQRELNYKHGDGSYSAFGKTDGSGNTWLTSFVMKSFGGARPYIFIDPEHIAQAKSWLSSHQQDSGCFQSVGKLLNNAMKGGVSDDVSLTAYITAALLELDKNTTDPMVVKSLECLKAAASQRDNLYTTALLSYTFTLAGDKETRSTLITHLHKVAKSTGGTRHWQRAEVSGRWADSLEVEMSSYVLLALLSGPLLPEFGLGYASTIVRWLTQQQNPYGGFASTQDTVVALQALALYGAATYSPEGASTVTVTSDGGYKQEFSVDQHNRLLYQEEQLKEVSGDYSIQAQGQSCVFVQIASHYNIPPPPDFTAFNISTTVLGTCNGTQQTALHVLITVRYNGRREETNMVIINVKLLSGFLLEKSSLKPLKRDPTVKRVDQEDGHIIIYLDGLKKSEPKTYALVLVEDVPVRNLKPAVVKVYDYYQTSDEAVSQYSSPCTEGDEINEL